LKSTGTNGFSIGEVARRAGLRPSALRYYEHIGLLTPQPRSGGQRRYDTTVFNVLAVIAFAKHAGFSIAETKLLLSGFGSDVTVPARWRSMAKRKQQELDGVVANAQRMKSLLRLVLRCKCVTFEECGRRINASRTTPVPKRRPHAGNRTKP
jgi:MerR family redox-sensitive transcriptional activator SoxR